MNDVKSSVDASTPTVIEEGLLPGKKPKPRDKLVQLAGKDVKPEHKP